MTHSPAAGTLYLPQWMNRPNFVFRNQYRACWFTVEGSAEEDGALCASAANVEAISTRDIPRTLFRKFFIGDARDHTIALPTPWGPR